MVKRLLTTLFLLLALIDSDAQEALYQDTTLMDMSVSISTRVEPNRVPLNRMLTYSVQISWEGSLDDIEMGDVEDPVLSNFDIVGTSSANRVMGTPEGRKAIKEIAYTLQPKTLGMGYVESVAVSYMNTRDGKTHYLKTERVAVEVISPVSEKNEKNPLWILVTAGGLFIVGLLSFLSVRRRRLKSNEKEEEIRKVIEEDFLEKLKTSVNLKEKNKRETFSVLTKLFRRYLSEKYHISALEATTEELIKILTEEDLDESLIRKCETLFNKADVVKFSGQDASQAELDEAYTTVETILESHLSISREQIHKAEEESAKEKKKRWGFFKRNQVV